MSLLANIIPGIDELLPLLNKPIWLYTPNMQCNFRCKYCYVNRAASPRGCKEHSHDFKIPDIVNTENKWIILYGGEPLTDKSLIFDLISKIRETTQNTITMSTNGSLLERSDIDFFEKNNVKLQLSYDGKYQYYRGPDVLKIKKDIIYDAINRNVINTINTIIHSKNFHDFKFDLPDVKVIHDYNFIYPIKTDINEEFILGKEYSDEIACITVSALKKLLLDLSKYKPEELIIKYPPTLFYLLENLLSFKVLTSSKQSFINGSLCSQTDCFRTDIYGNTTEVCGRGIELSVHKPTIAKACLDCKFLPIYLFKCPGCNFDKSTCKDTYLYKTYEKAFQLLDSINKD